MEECLQGKQLDLPEFLFPHVCGAERHSSAKPGVRLVTALGCECWLFSIQFKFPVLQFPSPHVGIVIKELRIAISSSCRMLDVSRESEAEKYGVIKNLHHLRKL